MVCYLKPCGCSVGTMSRAAEMCFEFKVDRGGLRLVKGGCEAVDLKCTHAGAAITLDFQTKLKCL